MPLRKIKPIVLKIMLNIIKIMLEGSVKFNIYAYLTVEILVEFHHSHLH